MARDDEAAELLQHALAIFTRTLHDEHPHVLACRDTWPSCGASTQARDLLQRAPGISGRILLCRTTLRNSRQGAGVRDHQQGWRAC